MKPFPGLLTDRSQARKTGDDKEMVLLKTDYKGLYDFFLWKLRHSLYDLSIPLVVYNSN